MNFKDNLLEYLNNDECECLLNSLQGKDKHAALLNLKKMNDETFLSLFPNVIPHPIVPHAYIYNKDEYDLGKSIYHELGCFYLQEPSAMCVTHFLDPKENEIILDLCAAPGGKTVQAAMLTNDKSVIVSNDISYKRSLTISENIERLGLGNVVITCNDFSLLYKEYLNYFDKIILDAPCSGSGMFRKSQEVKEDWTYQKVIKNQEIQKSLILIAYQMLKPGGKLIYSTCSFSKEEDEDVIKYALANTDFNVIELPDSHLLYVNRNNPLGIHLFPSIFPGEGHYMCLLEKPGSLVKIDYLSKENIIDKSLLKLINCDLTHKYVFKNGDNIFSLPFQIKTKNLTIIRPGVKILTVDKNNVIKYDYHFAHYLSSFNKIVDITYSDLTKYFKGECISINKEDKGWVLLKYNTISIDVTKQDKCIIKNHLPKGLRRHF